MCYWRKNKIQDIYWKTNKLYTTSSRSGVIGWMSGGIGKVVPQPETKYTEKNEKPDEEDTEVCLLLNV